MAIGAPGLVACSGESDPDGASQDDSLTTDDSQTTDDEGTQSDGTGGATMASGGGEGTGNAPGSGGDVAQGLTPRLTVYTRTTGYRHDSIPNGLALLQNMAAEEGWEIEATEDPALFTAGLAESTCVIFLNTTGDILDEAQQTTFEEWFKTGGAFVGIHAAADTEYDWPFYGQMVGAWFKSHPAIQEANVQVEDAAHQSTAHLPSPWTRTDEWYNFQSNPRANVNVLLTLDETTYSGGEMPADHPISWTQEIELGRSFYTGFGHTAEAYAEPAFVEQLRGALKWVHHLE